MAEHTTSWLGQLRLWLLAAAGGGLLGAGLAFAAPLALGPDGKYAIPLWLCGPFVLLLAMIALGPLTMPRLWHRYDAASAFFLGGVIAAYYLIALQGGGYGSSRMVHVAFEYISFIALVGGLYIASAGIKLETVAAQRRIKGDAVRPLSEPSTRRGTGPLANTLMLLVGAVLANFVGTTGASVLLIRPFMRSNAESNGGRLRPMHVLFFILIVSNCGGVITPIGDPPLYLGYIKGVPFFWTVQHLWLDWLLMIGGLLTLFFAYDTWRERRLRAALGSAYVPPAPVMLLKIRARLITLVLGGLMVACVFIDPLLHKVFPSLHVPVGPFFQIALAIWSFKTADPEFVHANEFSFAPVREVATLFVGIFLTMAPALAYIATNGASWGLTSPTALYWATGALSAVLDNAPTYLNFAQIALAPDEVTRPALLGLLATPEGSAKMLAISTSAVFFGALSYIGNGPNFMVRAIAESRGVAMPSFFAYVLKAGLVLGPLLVLHWLLMVR